MSDSIDDQFLGGREEPEGVESVGQVLGLKRQGEGEMKSGRTKKKRSPGNYYYFQMKGDMEDVYLKGAAIAARHRCVYDGLIVEEKVFRRKSSFLLHKQKHMTSALGVPVHPASNNERIVGLLGGTGSCNRIELHYRTTRTSRIMIIVIRMMDKFDVDTWLWSPEFMVPALQAHARGGHELDPGFSECLINIKLVNASNPNGSVAGMPLVAQYTPPNNPLEVISTNVRHAYSYITIPLEQINTRDDEDSWISDTARQVGQSLVAAMKTLSFRASLEKISLVRKRNHTSKICLPSHRLNLPAFLNSVVVRSQPIRRFTDHVTKSAGTELLFLLWSNRLGRFKYPLDPEEEGATGANAIELTDGEEDEEDSANADGCSGSRGGSSGAGSNDVIDAAGDGTISGDENGRGSKVHGAKPDVGSNEENTALVADKETNSGCSRENRDTKENSEHDTGSLGENENDSAGIRVNGES